MSKHLWNLQQRELLPIFTAFPFNSIRENESETIAGQKYLFRMILTNKINILTFTTFDKILNFILLQYISYILPTFYLLKISNPDLKNSATFCSGSG